VLGAAVGGGLDPQENSGANYGRSLIMDRIRTMLDGTIALFMVWRFASNSQTNIETQISDCKVDGDEKPELTQPALNVFAWIKVCTYISCLSQS